MRILARITTSLLGLLCFALPASATPTFVQNASGTTFPLTFTAVTAGNALGVFSDASVQPGSIQTNNGQTLTLAKGSCDVGPISLKIRFYLLKSSTGGETSITCTTCGSQNSARAYEWSGLDATNTFDHISLCTTLGFSAPCTINFNPGFSAEAVMGQFICTGSASTFTGTGVTWGNKTFPNGEGGAAGVTSAAGQITGTVDSGCGATIGIIVGLKGSGATLGCTSDTAYYDYSTELTSTGNPTIAANVNEVGDLLIAAPWCITSCTVTSVTMGSDTLTLAQAGNSNANTGQTWIYYKLASTVSGAQTLTFTPTGTRTHSQVTFYDFTPSAGCTFAHNVDSGVGTGTGTAINTPSITPTTGDLLFNITLATTHVGSVNSPWLCNIFTGASEDDTCEIGFTVNAMGYILSASAGATANNMTQISSSDWQALISSFKLTGTAAPARNTQVFVIHP
jgi:hypothetical protein